MPRSMNDHLNMANYLDLMTQLARDAGLEILSVYSDDDYGLEIKGDNSPLTRADLAAHRIIVSGLSKAAPEIPILSEESADISWNERSSWDRYFLVDPLDGTKEFISGNGEFTVNIAFIENGIPQAGVVYVPVKDVLYRADQTRGLSTVTRDGVEKSIRTRRLQENHPLVIVASRRHGGEAMGKCLAVLETHFSAIESTNMGSSLKLCLIAEGKADLYPRLAPTSEWDTAAAQAIVEAAGGRVVDLDLDVLRYNSKPDVLNPFFYVLGDTQFDWSAILSHVQLDL